MFDGGRKATPVKMIEINPAPPRSLSQPDGRSLYLEILKLSRYGNLIFGEGGKPSFGEIASAGIPDVDGASPGFGPVYIL